MYIFITLKIIFFLILFSVTPIGGEVAVSTELVREGTDSNGCKTMTVRTYVKDSGIGLSEADQMKLFTPYVQINPLRQGNVGTGLG